MVAVEKIVEMLALWTARIAQVALFVVTGIIILNILLRTPWGPLPGTYEMTEALGAVLMGLGVAYCAVMKGHVSVSILVDKFSPRVQALVDTCTNIIAFIFVGAVGRELFHYAGHLQERGYETTQLGLPQFPFYYLVAIGLLMLSIVLLLEVVRSLITFYKEVRK